MASTVSNEITQVCMVRRIMDRLGFTDTKITVTPSGEWIATAHCKGERHSFRAKSAIALVSKVRLCVARQDTAP